MIHLPKNRTSVKVWPDPARQVPAQPPNPKAAFLPMMPAEGMTVVWDEFRYRQYLAGDIHLFDPKTGKGEPYEHEHPHHEHNLEVAATWKGEHGDRARKRLAELGATRQKLEPRILEPGEVLQAAAPPPGVSTAPPDARAGLQPPFAELAPVKSTPAFEAAEKTAIPMVDGKGELASPESAPESHKETR